MADAELERALGCSKCRYSQKGCQRCRHPNFRHKQAEFTRKYVPHRNRHPQSKALVMTSTTTNEPALLIDSKKPAKLLNCVPDSAKSQLLGNVFRSSHRKTANHQPALQQQHRAQTADSLQNPFDQAPNLCSHPTQTDKPASRPSPNMQHHQEHQVARPAKRPPKPTALPSVSKQKRKTSVVSDNHEKNAPTAISPPALADEDQELSSQTLGRKRAKLTTHNQRLLSPVRSGQVSVETVLPSGSQEPASLLCKLPQISPSKRLKTHHTDPLGSKQAIETDTAGASDPAQAPAPAVIHASTIDTDDTARQHIQPPSPPPQSPEQRKQAFMQQLTARMHSHSQQRSKHPGLPTTVTSPLASSSGKAVAPHGATATSPAVPTGATAATAEAASLQPRVIAAAVQPCPNSSAVTGDAPVAHAVADAAATTATQVAVVAAPDAAALLPVVAVAVNVADVAPVATVIPPAAAVGATAVQSSSTVADATVPAPPSAAVHPAAAVAAVQAATAPLEAEATAAVASASCPRASLWVPPASPYGLLEEVLYDDPWRMLLACMLLNKTSSKQVRSVIWNMFQRYPMPQALIAADTQELQELLKPLGLFRKRAVAVQRFSQEYLQKQWEDPTELYGIGKYAADAYYMFCRGEWRHLKPDDKDLKKYHAWLVQTDGQGTGLQRESIAHALGGAPDLEPQG